MTPNPAPSPTSRPSVRNGRLNSTQSGHPRSRNHYHGDDDAEGVGGRRFDVQHRCDAGIHSATGSVGVITRETASPTIVPHRIHPNRLAGLTRPNWVAQKKNKTTASTETRNPTTARRRARGAAKATSANFIFRAPLERMTTSEIAPTNGMLGFSAVGGTIWSTGPARMPASTNQMTSGMPVLRKMNSPEGTQQQQDRDLDEKLLRPGSWYVYRLTCPTRGRRGQGEAPPSEDPAGKGSDYDSRSFAFEPAGALVGSASAEAPKLGIIRSARRKPREGARRKRRRTRRTVISREKLVAVQGLKPVVAEPGFASTL